MGHMRIGFCVSGFGRAAIHTIKYLKRTRTDLQFFVLLSSTAEPSLKSVLTSMEVETTRISHLRARIQSDLEDVMLVKHPCDFWVLTFRHLVPEPVVNQLPGRIINLHPTLLPSFAGLHGLENQKRSTSNLQGATCHFVDEGIDLGPIISTFVMPRNPGLEWEQSEAAFARGVKLLHTQTTIWMADGRVTSEASRPQVQGASYATLPFVPSIDEPGLVFFTNSEIRTP